MSAPSETFQGGFFAVRAWLQSRGVASQREGWFGPGCRGEIRHLSGATWLAEIHDLEAA